MAQTYSGYVGNPYSTVAKQTATVTVGVQTNVSSVSNPRDTYSSIVSGNKTNTNTYSITSAVDNTLGATASVNTTGDFKVREWGDEFANKIDDDVQSQASAALLRFLEDPTRYKSAIDETGRTSYDIARQAASQDAQTQRDRTIEQLRGNLAAQGISGAAAEQMIANAMVQSDMQKAAKINALTAQELSEIDKFAREAQLQAASTYSDIYGQEKEIESSERIVGAQLTSAEQQALQELESKEALGSAQLTSDERQALADLRLRAATSEAEIQSADSRAAADRESEERQAVAKLVSDENLTRIKGDIELALQESAVKVEANIKAKLDRGFNLGAADRLNGETKSDADLKALGFDQNQIDAYRSGFSGTDVRVFEERNAARAQMLTAAMLNPGVIDEGAIDSFINAIYGSGDGSGVGNGSITNSEPRYSAKSGSITTGLGTKPSIDDVKTMFTDGKNADLYSSLIEEAPELDISINSKRENTFGTLPEPGTVVTKNGRPLVVVQVVRRYDSPSDGFDVTNWDGETETIGAASGRASDSIKLMDLATGIEWEFGADNRTLNRGETQLWPLGDLDSMTKLYNENGF